MADGDLRKLFITNIERVHWQAIETGSTGKGIPDLNGCASGHELWIEMKKADHWAVEIRPEQVAWIERRVRNGGRCFVAARRAREELWLMAPGAARHLATRGESLRTLPVGLLIGKWAGGPRLWDWRAVRAALFPAIP